MHKRKQQKRHVNKKQMMVRAIAIFLVGLMLLGVLGALLDLF